MKGAKAPFAFNRHVFLNFLESLKIRPAWRKDFFDTLTLERITKLTEQGKVKWECVKYNPLCLMDEDVQEQRAEGL